MEGWTRAHQGGTFLSPGKQGPGIPGSMQTESLYCRNQQQCWLLSTGHRGREEDAEKGQQWEQPWELGDDPLVGEPQNLNWETQKPTSQSISGAVDYRRELDACILLLHYCCREHQLGLREENQGGF